jgi:hypothetical protein
LLVGLVVVFIAVAVVLAIVDAMLFAWTRCRRSPPRTRTRTASSPRATRFGSPPPSNPIAPPRLPAVCWLDARGRIDAAGGDDTWLPDPGRQDRAEPLANPARARKGRIPMRKIWGAGAVIMVCLALAAPALAQESSSSARPVASPIPGTTVPVVFSGEEWPTTQKVEASDPRVSGNFTMTDDQEVLIPDGSVGAGQGGFVAWGTYTLDGPDGDWVGPWTQMAGWDFPSVSRVLATLEGTEAYEGLAAVLWITLPAGWDGQGPGTVEGVIYEGPAPRLEWA